MSVVWRLICLSLLLVSCSTDNDPIPMEEEEEPIAGLTKEYIYISHTRTDDNSSIFNKVHDIDFSPFDLKILGGDLANDSFANETIIGILDDAFDLTNEKTRFSIGNHDDATDQYFKAITNKSKYNVYQQDDVSFITLDTQRSSGSILGNQKIFFDTVMDTITTKNIVILSHKLIYMVDHPVMNDLISDVSNGPMGNCSYCLGPNNFQEYVYPKLLEARGNNKEVFWIGGDLGRKRSSFEYRDGLGIQFLGNGFWYQEEENEVLLLTKSGDEITYKFQDLDEFIADQ